MGLLLLASARSKNQIFWLVISLIVLLERKHCIQNPESNSFIGLRWCTSQMLPIELLSSSHLHSSNLQDDCVTPLFPSHHHHCVPLRLRWKLCFLILWENSFHIYWSISISNHLLCLPSSYYEWIVYAPSQVSFSICALDSILSHLLKDTTPVTVLFPAPSKFPSRLIIPISVQTCYIIHLLKRKKLLFF